MDLLKKYISTINKDFLFITLSGAHIYGFPSPDSDFDLRGVHIWTPRDVFSLKKSNETYEVSTVYENREIDFVSHEVEKYFSLLLRGNNGYVMEQIYSPLVIQESNYFPLLKDIASGFICKLLYHHYRGFAGNQLKLIAKQEAPSAKSFLYLYRVLMTGIEVLKTGRIETDIVKLNRTFDFDFIPKLIEIKKKEKSKISPGDVDFYMKREEFLEKELDRVFENSPLPERPGEIAFKKLNDFFYDIRFHSLKSTAVN